MQSRYIICIRYYNSLTSYSIRMKMHTCNECCSGCQRVQVQASHIIHLMRKNYTVGVDPCRVLSVNKLTTTEGLSTN